MQEAIALRHRVVRTMRQVLDARDFLEIETPFLTRSTPEGARDFLVPARIAPGSFYALPQSPQLFKQLLMIGGFERYYQIVRCFRDEDARADRLPEFTQLDIEMGFVEEDDVLELSEEVMGAVFADAGFDLPGAAMAADDPRRGDEPVRLRPSGYPLRPGARRPRQTRWPTRSSRSSPARCRAAESFAASTPARTRSPALTSTRSPSSPSSMGPRAWCGRSSQDDADAPWRSPVAKFLSAHEIAAINERLGAKTGDVLLIVADEPAIASQALGALRLELARRFDLVPAGTHDIRWIVRFPMFAYKPDEERWDAEHHPFTAPSTAAGELATAADLDDPPTLLSRSYDLVLDGNEIGGGSIRIHRLDVQRRVFELIGIDEADAKARFGFLLDAFSYGTPPHGGIAMGIDRIVALLAGRDNIREVIAFPKATTGADPLTGRARRGRSVQLRELGLRLRESARWTRWPSSII